MCLVIFSSSQTVGIESKCLSIHSIVRAFVLWNTFRRDDECVWLAGWITFCKFTKQAERKIDVQHWLSAMSEISCFITSNLNQKHYDKHVSQNVNTLQIWAHPLFAEVSNARNHCRLRNPKKWVITLMAKKNAAVTRIRTWVIAATTQCTNHYTITALSCMAAIVEITQVYIVSDTVFSHETIC